MVLLVLVALAPSCGGRSVHRADGDAGERPTDTGGTPGSGGSAAQAGAASSSGGKVGSGGSTGTGGAASVAGTGGVAGCEALPCPQPLCPDGVLVSEPCGCPHCS